jgi:hypothetical protein
MTINNNVGSHGRCFGITSSLRSNTIMATIKSIIMASSTKIIYVTAFYPFWLDYFECITHRHCPQTPTPLLFKCECRPEPEISPYQDLYILHAARPRWFRKAPQAPLERLYPSWGTHPLNTLVILCALVGASAQEEMCLVSYGVLTYAFSWAFSDDVSASSS